MITILNRSYPEPPLSSKEILRYAGCKESNGEISLLLEKCIKETMGRLSYKVCFAELPVKISGKLCDFGCFKVESEKLALNLEGSGRVILFGATVGVQIDRLISKYKSVSPAAALFFQAIGTERIEALCDAFCEDIARERSVKLKPRFSPGYGDLPLDIQRDIFSLLECEKRIGITLNDSLLMSPTKSVTAFVGII